MGQHAAPRKIALQLSIEVGDQYIGKPTLQLSLSGNDCDSQGNCEPIAIDPSRWLMS